MERRPCSFLAAGVARGRWLRAPPGEEEDAWPHDDQLVRTPSWIAHFCTIRTQTRWQRARPLVLASVHGKVRRAGYRKAGHGLTPGWAPGPVSVRGLHQA